MFGFEARNGAGSVLISDSKRHLTYKERGQLVVSNSVIDRPSTNTFAFTSPVTTTEPPTVFMRVNESRHDSVSMYVALVGSPGNWTGVKVIVAASGGSVAPRYVFDIVIGHFKSSEGVVSDFGMVIYGESGEQVFSDKDRLVTYSKFTKKWTASVTGSYPNYAYYSLTPDVIIEDDDYVDVSSLNRGGIFQYLDGTMYTSVNLRQGGVNTLRLTTQCNLQYATTASVAYSNLRFCMAVCKFPLARYP